MQLQYTGAKMNHPIKEYPITSKFYAMETHLQISLKLVLIPFEYERIFSIHIKIYNSCGEPLRNGKYCPQTEHGQLVIN